MSLADEAAQEGTQLREAHLAYLSRVNHVRLEIYSQLRQDAVQLDGASNPLVVLDPSVLLVHRTVTHGAVGARVVRLLYSSGAAGGDRDGGGHYESLVPGL